MSAAPGAEALAELIRRRDPLAAARSAPVGARPLRLAADPDGCLVDGEREGSLAEHRAAHAAGRRSVAALAYGADVPPERTAARLAALAELARETGMLLAVQPVPAEGDARRPGSWGVEDLTVIAAARAALPEDVAVRPCWRLLGPGACQVAVAAGADEWDPPEGERTDLTVLAQAVGRELV
jgi:hypothetical protein